MRKKSRRGPDGLEWLLWQFYRSADDILTKDGAESFSHGGRHSLALIHIGYISGLFTRRYFSAVTARQQADCTQFLSLTMNWQQLNLIGWPLKLGLIPFLCWTLDLNLLSLPLDLCFLNSVQWLSCNSDMGQHLSAVTSIDWGGSNAATLHPVGQLEK